MSAQKLFRFLLCAFFLAFGALTTSAADTGNSPPLGSVRLSELPVEAQSTLELIRRGGPFPYRRDGVTFQNRELRLPRRPADYYHEYTVPTPGASDRGPRRIIRGEPEEYYYTADHYRSFRRIQP
ncbi:ribonuclease domain-containing protein [Uliginosibacterium gangwonense]|uniref:ribonuclease domain-containing protein n=1 Tax=Uliginosibacterium gangwonense TaxID=392736 RepID=UPI0003674342|nr:ribonuclease domain-containing protein [Uliginosibacterium gangwonense]